MYGANTSALIFKPLLCKAMHLVYYYRLYSCQVNDLLIDLSLIAYGAPSCAL